MTVPKCLFLVFISIQLVKVKSFLSIVDKSQAFQEESKCFGELGCVNITKDWYNPIYRPINVLPEDRDIVNTRFLLYTIDDPKNGQPVTADDLITIKVSNFDVKNPIVFIVHDFMEDGDTPWLTTMIENILSFQRDYNVLKVDWGSGAIPPYTLAVANARLVGLEIGFLAKTLIKDFGANASDIHIIGQGLGAHIAGYSADTVQELGMITGLDPAGPYFHGMPQAVRLDYSDAKFVQAIHTDTPSDILPGLGIRDTSGHVDFYPNNGQKQPGCIFSTISLEAITREMVPAIRETLSCSHLRAGDLFIDSLYDGCYQVGYECEDYGTFLNGECYDCGDDNSKCAVMGMKAIAFASTGRKEVKMYLKTRKVAPYCTYAYHVKVNLADPSKAQEWLRGKLHITLHGSLMSLSDYKLTPDKVKFYHGKEYTFFFTSEMNVGQVQSVELEWQYERNLLDPVCILFCSSHLYVASVDVSILNHYPEMQLKKFTTHLAPSDSSTYVDISSGDWGTFA